MSAAVPSPHQAEQFRRDINGLRAWAVAAVVLYHFGIPGFAGGFVGVDVFFVISGFLMSGIIIGALRTGRFSFMAFYLARARRILPALLVLCLVLLVLGWFWLTSIDYRTLGSHVAAALLFVSNLKFWREAGYFDAASHDKWLLHTWSLAVEWQFYLLLPLLLWAAFRVAGERAVRRVLTGLTLLSLLLCLLLGPQAASAAFYLLPSRAWEMLAGALVWYYAGTFTGAGKWLERCGLLLIALAVVGFDAGMAWPGMATLLPVAGSVLVLAAAQPHSPFTANRIMQYLGTRSYSIYLWHWPLVVALSYADLRQSWPWIGLALAATLLLGELSYRLVEAPARHLLARLGQRGNLAALAATTGVLVALALGVRLLALAGRLPEAIEHTAAAASDVNPGRARCHQQSGSSGVSCIYGGTRIRAVVLGDSHADATVTAVRTALPSAADGVLGWTYSSCPTLLGARHRRDAIRCLDFNRWALRQLQSLPPEIPLILVSRTSAYAFGDAPAAPAAHASKRSGAPTMVFSHPYPAPTAPYLAEFRRSLIDTACTLARQRPVYLVRPIPEMPRPVPQLLSRHMLLGLPPHDVSIRQADYTQRHAFVWDAQNEAARRCGVTILDPLPYLCSGGRCWGSRGGQPWYFDDNHLSEQGNRHLVPMFRRVFAAPAGPLAHGAGLPTIPP